MLSQVAQTRSRPSTGTATVRLVSPPHPLLLTPHSSLLTPHYTIYFHSHCSYLFSIPPSRCSMHVLILILHRHSSSFRPRRGYPQTLRRFLWYPPAGEAAPRTRSRSARGTRSWSGSCVYRLRRRRRGWGCGKGSDLGHRSSAGFE
jgi:hypothetical protein